MDQFVRVSVYQHLPQHWLRVNDFLQSAHWKITVIIFVKVCHQLVHQSQVPTEKLSLERNRSKHTFRVLLRILVFVNIVQRILFVAQPIVWVLVVSLSSELLLPQEVPWHWPQFIEICCVPVARLSVLIFLYHLLPSAHHILDRIHDCQVSTVPVGPSVIVNIDLLKLLFDFSKVRYCPVEHDVKPLFDQVIVLYGCDEVAFIRQMPLGFGIVVLIVQMPIEGTSIQRIEENQGVWFLTVPIPNVLRRNSGQVHNPLKGLVSLVSRGVQINSPMFIQKSKPPKVWYCLLRNLEFSVFNCVPNFVHKLLGYIVIDSKVWHCYHFESYLLGACFKVMMA